jgi:hypothetical protein
MSYYELLKDSSPWNQLYCKGDGGSFLSEKILLQCTATSVASSDDMWLRDKLNTLHENISWVGKAYINL